MVLSQNLDGRNTEKPLTIQTFVERCLFCIILWVSVGSLCSLFFLNSFSWEQAPFWNNFESTNYYISPLKNSCDSKLIQCGNEKEEKKRRKNLILSWHAIFWRIKNSTKVNLKKITTIKVSKLFTLNSANCHNWW